MDNTPRLGKNMIKILANDGIHPDGRLLLEEANYIVEEDKIPQESLTEHIGEYDVLIVRSATKVTRAVIDAGKNLKIIARGGVGLDNIDVEYAQSRGIEVFNTPNASSRAVAELTLGHIFALSRMIHLSNRELASGGDFKNSKELRNRRPTARAAPWASWALAVLARKSPKLVWASA